jgi:hypothetical protein
MTVKKQRNPSHPTYTIVTILLSFLLTPALSFAEIRFWGYTGIAGPDGSRLSEVMSAGVRINLASIYFPEVWTATNLGPIMSSFQSAGVKASISLDDVLFIKTYVSSSNCQDTGGPFVWRIRGNWQSRLANFVSQNGSYINPNTTWFIIVFSEVNNACLSLAQVQTAASAVKSYFPSVPTVMGYGFEGSYGQPAPASIPPAIDWVGFWNYGYFDPADPSHPYNANSGFLTTYNDLLAKLSPNQRIILVPDGFWAIHLHSHLNSENGPGTGWPKWYLQYLALNYERFALSQPKVIGMIVFSWPSALPDITGTKDLPQAIRDRHREIGCRNLGGCM